MLNKAEILKNARKIAGKSEVGKEQVKKLEIFLDLKMKQSQPKGKSSYAKYVKEQRKQKVLNFISSWEKETLDKIKIKEVNSKNDEQVNGEIL